MSRNSEKSQSVLHRFQTQKNREHGVLESNPNLRPKYIQSVKSLPQAEKWRSVVLSEISVRITRISDPSLNDYQIRDLNDELNKLFNEKRAWEHHIKSLGGADYITFGKNLEHIGVNIKGYRYFGRAKELPDVKEILDLQKKKRNENSNDKHKKELNLQRERESRIGGFYYGYYDELSNQENNEINILKQVNEIVGDGEELVAIPKIPTDNSNQINGDNTEDDLLNFEQNKSKKLLKILREQAKENVKDFIPIERFETPSMLDIEKWLVDKRREEIINRLKHK